MRWRICAKRVKLGSGCLAKRRVFGGIGFVLGRRIWRGHINSGRGRDLGVGVVEREFELQGNVKETYLC